MSKRWDEYFLQMALTTARMSKDPSTKVGAILVRNKTVLSTGFNGFPRGVVDDSRLTRRDEKLDIIVHAEMNAILAAARMGTSIEGSTIYVAATNGTQEIWGGPPCVRCTVECMQAGVIEFVSRPMKLTPSRWQDSLQKAHNLIREAGLRFREVALPNGEYHWCSPDAELDCEKVLIRCHDCPLDVSV